MFNVNNVTMKNAVVMLLLALVALACNVEETPQFEQTWRVAFEQPEDAPSFSLGPDEIFWTFRGGTITQEQLDDTCPYAEGSYTLTDQVLTIEGVTCASDGRAAGINGTYTVVGLSLNFMVLRDVGGTMLTLENLTVS